MKGIKTLDQIKTEYYGEIGTPERDRLENELEALRIGFKIRNAREQLNMTQEQLAHVQFPLGEMEKSETRKIAEENGFINADKKDSQDICFVPNGDYAAFIEDYTGKKYPEGDFVDTSGNVLGKHKGIIRYTIGQRKGLGLALPCPMYVKEKDLKDNKVVLCLNDELFSKELYANDFNWVSIEEPKEEIRCKARIR